MQNDKLLPCPFCGEKDLIRREQMRFKDSTPENIVHEDGTMKWSYIECGRCGCSTKAYCYEYQSTKKWNTRKPMERIVEQLEERKEDIAGYIDDDIFLGEYRAYRSAIDIVKGGVDNG